MKLKKQPNDLNLENTYKNIRNNVTAMIKKLKNEYNRSKILLIPKNPRKAWNTIKEVTVKANKLNNQYPKEIINQNSGENFSDDQAIANEFNKPPKTDEIGLKCFGTVYTNISEFDNYYPDIV